MSQLKKWVAYGGPAGQMTQLSPHWHHTIPAKHLIAPRTSFLISSLYCLPQQSNPSQVVLSPDRPHSLLLVIQISGFNFMPGCRSLSSTCFRIHSPRSLSFICFFIPFPLQLNRPCRQVALMLCSATSFTIHNL